MKKLFINYEEKNGRFSLIRFINFSKLNCSKVNLKKLLKSLEKFEKKVIENEMFIKKDYYNFRKFVLENNK